MPHIIGSVFFALIGVVATTMAVRGLTARAYLPFHQQALGMTWEQLTPGEQEVGLALTRTLGLGFLTAAVSLFAATGFALFGDRHAALLLGCVGLVFCTGLTFVNRELQATTAVKTPWRGALYAALAVAVGMVLCAIG